ncbi:MAG: hypothetical protein IT438_10175 [Phycisphaerales bacterium]|nr:hypothetical protein [Phycisphaerales bacterium]
MRKRGSIPAGAARASAVVSCLALAAIPLSAGAQTVARPFSRDIYYTVAGSPTRVPELKAVTVGGLDVASASLSNARALSAFANPQPVDGMIGPGVGDLVFGPDGDLLVAGAANRLYKVRPEDGLSFPVQAAESPGGLLGPPTVTTLICDPATDKAWSFSTEALASIVGLLPGPTANAPVAITGSDIRRTRLHSLVWAPGAPGESGAIGTAPRVLYTAIATSLDGVETHHLGRIDMDTLVTTRLISNLPAARAMVLDTFTGKLILFGDRFIAQLNPDPITPIVERTLDLNSIEGAQGMILVDGTADAEGRLYAVGHDGRLVILDYSQTRDIQSASNRVKVLSLESHEPGQEPAGVGAPGAVQGLAPLSGPGRAQLAYCLWDNGGFDGLNGQASRTDTYSGAPMTADDFYFEPGSIYRIDTVTALLATNSVLPKARLTIFEDCDGLPGRQIASYESLRMVNTGTFSDALPVYRAEFALGGLHVSTDMLSQDGAGGGRVLWAAVQGVALGLPDEEWYWCTANNLRPRGSSARFFSPSLGYPEWTPIDTFGCGCTDFAFAVIGERCKVLYNGGELDLAATPAGSLSQIAGVSEAARSADNFVLPPCAPADRIASVRETLCYIRAYVYSNCTPVRGRFELYPNTCKSPPDPATPTSPPTPLYSTPFARITDLGFTAMIDGEPVNAYCVEAVGLDWNLPSGNDYWISAVGETNGGLRKRNYFAFGSACARGCPVQFSPAMVVGQGAGADTWRRIEAGGQSRDLALLVAARQPIPLNASGPSGNGATPGCPADTNRSGTITLQDLFDFITSWFQGCP